MNLTDKQKEVLDLAIHKYGVDAQIDMIVEECSELIKAICKWKRTQNIPEMIDETADVYIMLKQIEIMFGQHDNIQNRIDFKIERLQKRLEER